MKVASEFEKVVSEKLGEVYDQAINHCITKIRLYPTNENYELKIILEEIIQDLEKLKK